MKKSVSILIGLFLIISCSDREPTNEGIPTLEASFSIEEAKTYFETNYVNHSITRSDEDVKGFLSLGEFTPLWNDAIFHKNSTAELYYIPIVPEYKYRAIRSDFQNGKATAYIVPVNNLLVVEKRGFDNKIRYHTLLLVPNNSSSAPFNKLLTKCGSDTQFSGLAISSSREAIFEVVEYRDGAPVTKTANSVENSDIVNIHQALDSIKFQYTPNVMYRSQGEDDEPIWIDEDNIETNDSMPSKPSYAPVRN